MEKVANSKVPKDFDPETEFLFVDSEPEMPKEPKKIEKEVKKIGSLDELYEEMVLQNTYTDIVDTILRYLKQIKGSPADLVEILDFTKTKLENHLKSHDFEEVSEQKMDERDGSKILKLINYHGLNLNSLLVDFHLKMVYSAHKNKKAPAYMLKSILISLDKV